MRCRNSIRGLAVILAVVAGSSAFASDATGGTKDETGYTLTYIVNSLYGTLIGTSPQTVPAGGDGAAVTVQANPGYAFSQWSDGVTDNPRTDTSVLDDITVNALFTAVQYTLTYTAGPNGHIEGDSPQTVGYGADGTAVTAVADTDFVFIGWSDGSTDNPRTDTGVMADVTVEALFAESDYTLTYAAGPNGHIEGDSPQTVGYGADGTAVTAVADGDYLFIGWSDGSTDNPRTDTGVTADIAVTANFARAYYLISYSAGDHGTIDGGAIGMSMTVSYGADGPSVPANPDPDYIFLRWSDGSTDNPRTDTHITNDISVQAIFVPSHYTLTYTADANGTISGDTPQTVAYGADGTAVTAVSNDADHFFVRWSDGSTDNPRTDTGITSDLAVQAVFAAYENTLTYTASAHGHIEGDTPQTVAYGADGTAVTAVPDEGCFFARWSDGVMSAVRQDTNVVVDVSVQAIFGLIITTVEELQQIGVDAGYPLDGYYRLDADLDLSGLGFTPIGSSGTPFTGYFDGNGHSITGFSLSGWTDSDNGLFRVIGGGGMVLNLSLIDANVPASGYNTGALCGQNYGTIRNCHSTGSVYYNDYAPFRGGLVGINNDTGVIEDSWSSAEVCGRGGCTGGLVGINYGTLTRCHASGNVHGRENTGGLIGYCLYGTLTDCYATGNVDSIYDFGTAGGLSGMLGSSTVRNCFATGNVTNSTAYDVGGFSGDGWGVDMKNCFATGKVTAGGRCSALAGGQTDGSIDSCFAVGTVSGAIPAGLLGYDGGPRPSFSNCYWDIDTTLQTESVTGQAEVSFGRTTEEMLQAATYVGWEVGSGAPFSIIENKTYPYFSWKAPEVVSLVPAGFPSAGTVEFMVTFSMPVPGFAASDVLVSTTGVNSTGVTVSPVEVTHPTQWLLDVACTGDLGTVTVLGQRCEHNLILGGDDGIRFAAVECGGRQHYHEFNYVDLERQRQPERPVSIFTWPRGARRPMRSR